MLPVEAAAAATLTIRWRFPSFRNDHVPSKVVVAQTHSFAHCASCSPPSVAHNGRLVSWQIDDDDDGSSHFLGRKKSNDSVDALSASLDRERLTCVPGGNVRGLLALPRRALLLVVSGIARRRSLLPVADRPTDRPSSWQRRPLHCCRDIGHVALSCKQTHARLKVARIGTG